MVTISLQTTNTQNKALTSLHSQPMHQTSPPLPLPAPLHLSTSFSSSSCPSSSNFLLFHYLSLPPTPLISSSFLFPSSFLYLSFSSSSCPSFLSFFLFSFLPLCLSNSLPFPLILPSCLHLSSSIYFSACSPSSSILCTYPPQHARSCSRVWPGGVRRCKFQRPPSAPETPVEGEEGRVQGFRTVLFRKSSKFWHTSIHIIRQRLS